MAQTGYTPILIYSSSTGSQAPAAGNLTNSTLGSELAINITDGKLFYKDNLDAVQVIAWKVTPTTAGGTGLTSYAAGDLLYYASGTTLTKLAIGASGRWLGSSGTAPQWNAPAALTKTDDTNVTLTLGGNASTALLNAASLTLGWTGTLAVSRGGTGTGTAFTAGSVVFAGASGVYSQDNTNFFWDNTNKRIGFGIASPSTRLHVYGAGTASNNWANTDASGAALYLQDSGGGISNGGQILFGAFFGSFAGIKGVLTDGTGPSGDLVFQIRGTSGNIDERVRFFSNGGVSIANTTNPGAGGLYATGNGSFGLTGTGGRLSVRGETSDATKYTLFTEAQDGTDQLAVRCDGAVYMGLDGASPYNLTTATAANATLLSDGFFYRSTSSIKYKQNVQNATHGLAEVMALRPVTYEGKSDVDAGKVFGGLIAEEVHDAGLTEFVQYAEDGSPDALSYGNMVSLLVKAIQELNAKIELQSIEIAKLKGN